MLIIGLIAKLAGARIGLRAGGRLTGALCYAEDLVLLAHNERQGHAGDVTGTGTSR